MSAPTHHETVMDPTADRLAMVYAEALLAAVPREDADALGQGLADVAEMLCGIDGLEQLIQTGGMPRAKATKLFDDALADRVPEPIRALVASLNRRGRLGLLGAIARQFVRAADRQAGKVEATLMSAQPLTDVQRAQAIERLSSLLDAPIVLHARVDPRLIGGAMVEVEGVTYDASVRTQLQKLAHQANERFERTDR
jgi:ATP synthase F1 delta subunit